MRVRLDACALAVVGTDEERFEAVRERVVPVAPGAHHGIQALEHAQVECRDHELIEGHVCVHCDHLLNAVPSADGHSVRVRCMFLESDPIEKLMIRAADVVSVAAGESLAAASRRMVEGAAEQALVVAEGKVIGLLAARDLEGAEGEDGTVEAHTSPLPVVPRTMALGAVARTLRENRLDCLAIVDRDELVGFVTRGDLRRLGVPGL
jgi:CBS domain-containing protein